MLPGLILDSNTSVMITAGNCGCPRTIPGILIDAVRSYILRNISRSTGLLLEQTRNLKLCV